MVLLVGSECFAQMVFKSVQALEDPVVEELFTQIIPDMLYRIEFWCIGRQGEQMDIRRHFECVTAMPASTVNDHYDLFIRMPSRDFIKKQLHTFCVDVR